MREASPSVHNTHPAPNLYPHATSPSHIASFSHHHHHHHHHTRVITAMSAPARPEEHAQLTSANLTEQNRQLADLNIHDTPAGASNDQAGAAVESPTSTNAQLPAPPNDGLPVGQRSESYVERSTYQKKRKYSAELYQFHKGVWDDFK